MKAFCTCALLCLFSSQAFATYSIAACDQETGECGVAVATHNLAVGSSVPFARAKQGAGVSQFETNPIHATVILKALQEGSSAKHALEQALSKDGQFDDGQDTRFRQIGIVTFEGDAVGFTGDAAGNWAGHLTSQRVAIQGNGLVSSDVLTNMLSAFDRAQGPLAHRLLVALEAGHKVGGQTIGVTSAALLVSHPEGWPRDVDLRVDYSSQSAIKKLRQAYDARRAFDSIITARNLARRGDLNRAQEFVVKALELAPEWDRIWLRAARLAQQWDQKKLARDRMCQFTKLNPVWARQLMDETALSACE